jgi:hypothetical protein
MYKKLLDNCCLARPYRRPAFRRIHRPGKKIQTGNRSLSGAKKKIKWVWEKNPGKIQKFSEVWGSGPLGRGGIRSLSGLAKNSPER